MILDDEKHRAILLEMLKQMMIPGHSLDDVYALKQSIIAAPVAAKTPPDA